MNKIGSYILCYLLWFALSGVSVWTALVLRDAILGLLPLTGPWIMSALDKFGILFIGVVVMAWVFFLEGYLRTGVDRGILKQRIIRVGIVQVVILAIVYSLKLGTSLL